MALPQPTPLANTPKSGGDARLYMCEASVATLDEVMHEIPLTSEDLGVKGSGDVSSVRTHNGGMLYSKSGITKTFTFTMHAASNNTNVAAVITAADAAGEDSIMKFAIKNADGSYDYGFCVVNDKSAVEAPDGIFGWQVNCSVMGDGEFQAAV